MLTCKINVIKTLKESKENILSQSAVQKLRKGEMVGI